MFSLDPKIAFTVTSLYDTLGFAGGSNPDSSGGEIARSGGSINFSSIESYASSSSRDNFSDIGEESGEERGEERGDDRSSGELAREVINWGLGEEYGDNGGDEGGRGDNGEKPPPTPSLSAAGEGNVSDTDARCPQEDISSDSVLTHNCGPSIAFGGSSMGAGSELERKGE